MTPASWIAAIWLGGLLLGVSAFAVYAALTQELPTSSTDPPAPTPPWHVVALYRFGQALIALAIALATVGAATLIAHGALRAFGLR